MDQFLLSSPEVLLTIHSLQDPSVRVRLIVICHQWHATVVGVNICCCTRAPSCLEKEGISLWHLPLETKSRTPETRGTYHIDSKQSVDLDETVEIPKENGTGNHEEVHRIAEIVVHVLDEFADEHEDAQPDHAQSLQVFAILSRSKVQQG